MPLPKLALEIAQEGYKFSDGESTLRAKPSAGPSRFRKDMFGAPIELDMTLILGAAEYQYWRAFYLTTIDEGSLPFLIDLVINTAEPVEYQAQIIPGTGGLGTVQGDAHVVPFRLEVKAMPNDSAADAAVVMLFELYGLDAPNILDLLQHLVNVDIPEAAG